MLMSRISDASASRSVQRCGRQQPHLGIVAVARCNASHRACSSSHAESRELASSASSRRQSPSRTRAPRRPAAGAMDAMPTWTLDQIAGLAFGGVMAAFFFGAQYVDAYVARQQRRELGLCEECGGVYEPSTCRQAQCPKRGTSSQGGPQQPPQEQTPL